MKSLLVRISVLLLILTPHARAVIDSNGNGVSDLWERHFNSGELYSNLDSNADPDGDGWTNAQEAAAGTDPEDANPPIGFIVPQITHIPAVYAPPEEEGGEPVIHTPEAITIVWPTLEGKQYSLLFSPDLSPGSWIPVGNSRVGTGVEMRKGIPLTQPDGSIPDAMFWRVAVEDIDTDADGLTDAEELEIGSSIYLKDTDGDGLNDSTAFSNGLNPSGDGSDADGDGVPDNALYSVVFEVQHESKSMPYGVGWASREETDVTHRYLTSKDTEKYSVSGSARYSDVTDGAHVWTHTHLVNGAIPEDSQPVISEQGTPFNDWKSTHGTTLGEDESLHEDTTVTTVDGPTITPKQIKTVTTRSTPWTVKKDGNIVRSGMEIITVTEQNDLSDETTCPQFWNAHVKSRAWAETPPLTFSPLNGMEYNRGVASDALAAECIQAYFQNHDFGIYGNISNPGMGDPFYGSDQRLKSLRWRWIRFNPQTPFGYEYATPPAALSKSFHLLVSQRDYLSYGGLQAGDPISDETNVKGIVEIKCTASEGSADWQTVPLTKFASYQLEDPAMLADLDFSKSGDSRVSFENQPMLFVAGAGAGIHSTVRVMESSGPPTVHLETITKDDVQISGGEATVSIQGNVYDAIMGTVPAGGGADIEGVKVFLNGVETEFEGTLQRETDYKAFWSPEGPKAAIVAFDVNMPASGVNRITVETTPNAAGLKGRAEFDVVFEKTYNPSVSHSAQTIARDLLLPSSFSATSMETVRLVQPGQQTGDDLVETANDSHVFYSAQSGVSLVIDQTFQPSALPDGLPCVLSIPGVPVDKGSMGTAIVCQETGPASLRFAYNRSAAASSESSTYQWTLSAVDMAAAGYIGMAHPIAFQTPDLGDNASLEWLDTEFPITPHEDTFQPYASTAEGKPLIGFLIRKEDEDGMPSREFIYYDHEAGEIQRKEMPASVIKTTYKLKFGEINSDEFEIPVVSWRLLNHEGNPSDGLLPVSIESLIDLAEGDTSIEIPEESQGIVEITGRKAGVVLRMFSPEETADRFDLTVPGEDPVTVPAPRNAALVGVEEGVYRTEEKLVIYSSGGYEGPVTLTDSQWESLKAAGYLAVHNTDPVISSTEHLGWAMEKYGPPHPGADLPMGVNGVTDPRRAQFYRFEGYDDHHVFNQFSDNKPKRERWMKIFGNDFDVDEFTVPVKSGYHKKIGHQITAEWEEFLSQSFDSSHQLKPGVDLQQLRRDSLDKMRAINARWGIDTSRLRPYPQILDPRRPINALCGRLITNGGRIGSSLDKLKVIDEMAFGPVLKGANVARNAWWKETAKKLFKREGKKGVGKLIPILSSAITVASIASASANVAQVGWEEAVAQEINNQLALDDIELAREAVRQQFKTGLIGGGTPRPVLPLANGQVIGLNERTYKCYSGADGNTNSVIPYVISEIKVFPDGTTKIAAVMEVPPFESWIEENPDFIIRDYWPKIGDPAHLYSQARARARANSDGNP